jgi:DNA-directed RNA polymerase specialized sigma24 family protein
MEGRIRWTDVSVIDALRDWQRRYGEVPQANDWDQTKAKRAGHTARMARLAAHPKPVPSVSTVRARFGSWNAAIEAAGLQPRQSRRRFDIGERQATVALYASGLSTIQVAERLGIAPKTVRDRLHAADIPLRPARPRARPVPDLDLDARVLAASHDGATQHEIADRFSLSVHRVRSILKRHAVTGGRLIRQLRKEQEAIDALELTAQERDVIDLVIVRRCTHADAAQRLGVPVATIAENLRAVTIRLGRHAIAATEPGPPTRRPG